MAKLKKSKYRDAMHIKRDIFPRKAKEQSLVNLEQLAVIMDFIEADSETEDEKINIDHKKHKKKGKKSKKKSEFFKSEQKQVSQDQGSKHDLSEMENTAQSLNQKNKKNKSPVLLPNTGGLSHFMELGARTDLLCDSRMADPLGPDSFDSFQWVEVKQELPDDIEVCKITFTELPIKIDDLKGKSDVKIDDIKELSSELQPSSPAEETLPGNQSMDNLAPNEVLDKCTETDIVSDPCEVSGDDRFGDLLEGDESPDECFTERHETENIEANLSKKKRKNYPQNCDICGKKLCSMGNLRLHKLKKHKLKIQFTCELCSVKFDLQREAVQHRNSVHRGEDGRFGCGVCSRRVQDYHAFLVHVKSHVDKCKEEEGSDKVCTDCDKAFKDDDSLKIHQTLMHTLDLRGRLKSQEKNFICDTCGRRFAFSCLLRDHINTHTGAKPYLCQQCGKAFSQKSTLKQHTRTHSNVRPFQCSECPQGFYSKGDFVKHQRKHTGERPYICEVCGEGFSRSTHLVIHRRTHTGERPHTCDICDRGFTKRGDVVRHRRVHTGELPYLCQVCGKAFRQSTQCANHIKSQHPDSPAPVARNPNPLVNGLHLQLLS